MPRIHLDLTKVEAVGSGGGFPVFPADAGPYTLQVEGEPKVGNSKRSGQTMMTVVLRILDPEQFAGQTFRQWYSFTDKQPASGRLKALANACSVVYDRDGFNTEDFTNAVFVCDLVVEPDDRGREFNRIENPRAAQDQAQAAGAEEPPPPPEAAPVEPPASASTAPRRAPIPIAARTTAATAPVVPRRSVR